MWNTLERASKLSHAVSLIPWDESFSKVLLDSHTGVSHIHGAVIGPIPDPRVPRNAPLARAQGATRSWWLDPPGVGTMTQTAKTRDVYVREYVRIRFGREETVRQHWRSWPRQ
jgi:hypothetical protein